jgi:hypothetical protein
MRVKLSRNSLDDRAWCPMPSTTMLKLQAAATEWRNGPKLEYKVQKKTEELGAAQNESDPHRRLASLENSHHRWLMR